MSTPAIRPFVDTDLPWAERLIGEFGGRMQARLGELVDALAFPGLVAENGGERVGLLTYRVDGASLEVIYIETTTRHEGIGTRLLEALAEQAPVERMWLVTTNDNLEALRFYQRRGFRIAEVHPWAVDEARRALKPTIPEVGEFGIPVRDEIVLERARG